MSASISMVGQLFGYALGCLGEPGTRIDFVHLRYLKQSGIVAQVLPPLALPATGLFFLLNVWSLMARSTMLLSSSMHRR